ncbi:MAG TPA: hypothetical protein VKJ47_23465, partial [Candidatus Binatia bacterium]|nr:hypothetical protein [Candidatus Binatia bacterium]
MDIHNLINLDQTETSAVRRALHRWTNADGQAIRPLILAMQEKHYLLNFPIIEPRWETNVYPL